MRPTRLWLIVGGMACLVLARTSWRGVAAGEDEREAADPVSLSATLERRSSFPFGKETTLSAVVAHLRRDLNAQVVLDVGALKRLKIEEKTPVQLELKDVKRSTGLRLLLEQVGLTFRVEEDDNLLIITDRQGAADPLDRIEARLDDLHRDVHAIQDAVEEVYQTLAPEAEGPVLRSPTLIEEMPMEDTGDDATPAHTRPS